MKKVIIITVVLFLYFKTDSKAQGQYINESSSYIREAMRTRKFKLIGTGKTRDGEDKYINYSFASARLTFYFKIQEDKCIHVIQFDPKSSLKSIINYLNKYYIRMNDSTWESFNNDYKIEVDTERVPRAVIVTYSAQ